ncbi:hypothetical protein Phum_PHUM594680 [Pediculus humanus corporis]|uniref:Uncharacterized protein n=1 Tax=Pediculus humanus subsp. corporis TaxID=121224 RepID=E0W2K5_PEDHC|nr:uncharacterized protein Phum_PHUM594680 [Pediculus humanus corporis]EEB19861.1 hypothetical protein Phum_PHUM594680 [Pediculus humanus corporis]
MNPTIEQANLAVEATDRKSRSAKRASEIEELEEPLEVEDEAEVESEEDTTPLPFEIKIKDRRSIPNVNLLGWKFAQELEPNQFRISRCVW